MREVDPLAREIGGRHARHRKQRIDHRVHAVAGGDDAPDMLAPEVIERSLRVGVVLQQDVGEAVDHAQRCAQVVRDGVRKTVELARGELEPARALGQRRIGHGGLRQQCPDVDGGAGAAALRNRCAGQQQRAACGLQQYPPKRLARRQRRLECLGCVGPGVEQLPEPTPEQRGRVERRRAGTPRRQFGQPTLPIDAPGPVDAGRQLRLQPLQFVVAAQPVRQGHAGQCRAGAGRGGQGNQPQHVRWATRRLDRPGRARRQRPQQGHCAASQAPPGRQRLALGRGDG
jgi:hypothetical protein